MIADGCGCGDDDDGNAHAHAVHGYANGEAAVKSVQQLLGQDIAKS